MTKISFKTFFLLLFAASITAGCSDSELTVAEPGGVSVYWAIAPSGIWDMGYDDMVYAGICIASEQHGFNLYFYRPDSVEEISGRIEDWLREPLSDGSRSLFVLAGSEYETTVRYCMEQDYFPLPEGKDILFFEYFGTDLPVYTFGIITAGVAYQAGCLSDYLGCRPLVVAATFSDPQTAVAAEAFSLGANPDQPDEVSVIVLSDDYTGFAMADELYGMCQSLTDEYDFFFPYAGGSALGMYRYMRDYSGDWFVVGMDMDQSYLAPNIHCSMIKDIHIAIAEWMDGYMLEEEIPQHSVYGIESGLVRLAPSEGYEQLIAAVTEAQADRALEIENQFLEILDSND